MNRKIDRPISLWCKFAAAMTRLPEIGSCSRAFKNWAAMTRIYAGGAMPEDFVAHGLRWIYVAIA